MMTDHDYRDLLVLGGVRRDLIATLIGHDLDCVGNIVRIYRTSMKEQDPAAFAIAQNAAGLSEAALPVMSLRDWFAGSALPHALKEAKDTIIRSGANRVMEQDAASAGAGRAYLIADAMLRERERK